VSSITFPYVFLVRHVTGATSFFPFNNTMGCCKPSSLRTTTLQPDMKRRSTRHSVHFQVNTITEGERLPPPAVTSVLKNGRCSVKTESLPDTEPCGGRPTSDSSKSVDEHDCNALSFTYPQWLETPCHHVPTTGIDVKVSPDQRVPTAKHHLIRRTSSSAPLVVIYP